MCSGKIIAMLGNRAVTGTDTELQNEKKVIRIRIEFVRFVFLNTQLLTFINLNSSTCGNALYAIEFNNNIPYLLW